jgi:predicted O-methyltransferase YrrM
MLFKSRAQRQAAAAMAALEAVPASHKELSVIANAEGEASPTVRLLDVALAAVAEARKFRFAGFAGRNSTETPWFDIWPGEHYKLLAGLIRALGAKTVIEIGTFTGMSAVAIAEALPADGRLVTFDLKPWREFPNTWLREEDFAGGRIAQEIADIAAPGVIGRYAGLFAQADFIFIDGPKDGVTEPRFIDALASLELARKPIVMFDDIRVLNMVAIWRKLARPKLDLTSFGHWSGTGLVDWNG